jgi:hypothetical protein
VTVAKSISVEKHSIKFATLITALDLAQDKLVQIPCFCKAHRAIGSLAT